MMFRHAILALLKSFISISFFLKQIDEVNLTFTGNLGGLVRNDTVWNKTKELLSKVGGTCALELVKTISGKVILSQLGI